MNEKNSFIGKYDSWEIIDEKTAVKTCDKSFFMHRGSGVPKNIAWFFDAGDDDDADSNRLKLNYKDSTYDGHISVERGKGKRKRIFWETALGSLFAQYENVIGVKARFQKIGEREYDISFEGSVEPMKKYSTKEALNHISAYISSKGFTYDDDLLNNFYLSLKSKPFVILAGTSGTGKTRLVRLFAEAMGAGYHLVPVRPDWSDGSDLLGHYDLNGGFVEGPVCECFREAWAEPDKPVFLCLDEMNLARVEYYFSDFLSVIETREFREDGSIKTDELVKATEKSADAEKMFARGIPDNLYIVGTVNMDETTFPFSRKVLDRANTIEFSEVELSMNFNSVRNEAEQLNLHNDLLKGEQLVLAKDCPVEDQGFVTEQCIRLEEMNKILRMANAHVGYRVRDEIMFYMLANRAADGLIGENEAMDNGILQKILPRIQGSSSSIKDMLCELFKKCAGNYEDENGDRDSEKMRKFLDHDMGGDDTKKMYPKSARKIQMMVQRFEEDGFTSYWI